MLAYFDCFSGISGDMTLAALIDLGVPLKYLEDRLNSIPLADFDITVTQVHRSGIHAVSVSVGAYDDQTTRNFTDIRSLIMDCPLSERIKSTSLQIFKKLASAEARIHSCSTEEVHFHEVGAVDAIVDIVGSAIGLQLLEIQDVVSAPLPLSAGMTRGSHGSIPLPAPATVQILAGHPVRNAESTRELVTPTGAAIAATVARFGPMPEMSIDRIGYGVGGWDLEDRPNLLRGILGHREPVSVVQHDTVTVIESHIDDSSPELLGSLIDRMTSDGALDAALSPLLMKKNRPGSCLTVIAEPHNAATLADTLVMGSAASRESMQDTVGTKL